jgi:hypothetical protein
MRIIFIITFLIGLSSYGIGQILKIDKAHLDTDSSNYVVGVVDGSFSMDNSLSTDEQQITLFRLSNQTDVVYIGKKSANILLGQVDVLRRSDQGRFLNNGSLHLRRIFLRSARFTPVMLAQVQYAENRNLVNRQLYGAGIQWNILRGQQSLHMGWVPFFEHERWRNLDGGIVSKDLFKSNLYLGGDVPIGTHLRINTMTYWQIGSDREDDLVRNRIFSFLEVKQSISEKFRIKTALHFAYDQRPVIVQNTTIYNLMFGLEYHF